MEVWEGKSLLIQKCIFGVQLGFSQCTVQYTTYIIKYIYSAKIEPSPPPLFISFILVWNIKQKSSHTSIFVLFKASFKKNFIPTFNLLYPLHMANFLNSKRGRVITRFERVCHYVFNGIKKLKLGLVVFEVL